jgi:hypothetical protein
MLPIPRRYRNNLWIAKLVVRKALSFPDWTVSLRSVRGNRHRSHFKQCDATWIESLMACLR